MPPDSPHYVLRGKLPTDLLSAVFQRATSQPFAAMVLLPPDDGMRLSAARGKVGSGAKGEAEGSREGVERGPLGTATSSPSLPRQKNVTRHIKRRDVSLTRFKCRTFDTNATRCVRSRVSKTPCEWVRGECRASTAEWQAHLAIAAPKGASNSDPLPWLMVKSWRVASPAAVLRAGTHTDPT